MRSLLFACLLIGMTAAAQDSPFQPYTAALPSEGRFYPLDLSGVVNADGATPVPVDDALIGFRGVPFRPARGEGARHLNLQPLGWSAAENETRAEYKSYMATYDYFPEPGDPFRAAFEIPRGDYQAIWLLAATDDDPALTDALTIRLGRFGGRDYTRYFDFSARVPRRSETKYGDYAPWLQQRIAAPDGTNLYLIKIPLNAMAGQYFDDYLTMHLDITRQLEVAVNLPDPFRYQLRPLGDPSGVRIYAATLERCGLQPRLTWSQPGAVYNQPETPHFTIDTKKTFGWRAIKFSIDAVRDDGQTYHFETTQETAGSLPNGKREVDIPLTDPGHYALTIKLMQNDTVILTHHTTCAILAPDTRRYRSQSPWGTWDFAGGHFTEGDLDITGPLAVKAGMRFLKPSETYGLQDYRDPQINEKMVEKFLAEKAADPNWRMPPRGLIFHETSVSGPHALRIPDVFTGRTYTLTENDQERFQKLWDQAMTSYKLAREHFPEMEIYFGNGMPNVIEEFARHDFPKDYLRTAGNESGSFMRPPESQPGDLVANNAGIFMFRTVLDHYGYTDTKVAQCFEMCYPNTNPGNLSYRTQAQYFTRHMLHSLAWKIPYIRVGTITDMGNSYYSSNWGAAGLCFGYPMVTPKESYVAYAVLTQMLDGATFTRQVPTGTNHVYAFEFSRPADLGGGYVTAIWTARGARQLGLRLPGDGPVSAIGSFGRDLPMAVTGDAYGLLAGESVVYVRSPRPIASIDLGAASYEPPPEGEAFVISDLTDLEAWQTDNSRSYELDSYNFMDPRRPGDFRYAPVADLDGRPHVIQATAAPVDHGTEYMPMYSQMILKEPVEIPGVPTQIGLWVHTRSTWGRVIFELEDASGERFISIGAEQGGEPNPWMADWMPPEEFAKLASNGKAGISDWNSNDAWGRSRLNHDGWRYVAFPLPGQYGQNQAHYHWPATSQWRFSDDGKVTYPLTFKRLILTLPEKVLYGNEWRATSAEHMKIAVSGLQVTYLAPQIAFKAD